MEATKILMIDDEKSFCQLVKMNLEMTGRFRVYVANDGKEGLKAVKKIKPDLILLDVVMPKMEGVEVLEALKKNERFLAIPIIMLSARTDDATKIKTSSLYADRYVTKPVSAEALIEKIDEILNIGKKP